MKDIQTAVTDIQNAFDDAYPAGFLMKYEPIERLAGGRGTETFLVRQKGNEQLFVAKCYNKDFYTAIHESTILKSLNHYGLPAFADEFQNDNAVCVVREYVAGKPLDQYVREKTLLQKEIASICIQLCDILIYLHGQEHPIIHRDIKPQNIIVKPDGTISLIDFDIARVYRPDTRNDTQCVGTREYAPPEQYGFSQTDCRSDIYSSGVVLGWMLTCETDAKEVYRRAGRSRLTDIYRKCTAFSPEHRFKSAEKLKAALLRSDGKQKKAMLRRIAVFLSCLLFLCAGFVLGRFTGLLEANPQPDTGVIFEEPMIEQAVRLQLDKTTDEPLMQEELLLVDGLYIFGDSLIAKNEEELQAEAWKLFESNRMKKGSIRSLTDLSKMPNLEQVIISMQRITDISPLAGLQKLEAVDIKNNPVTDISPLGELKFLKRVSLFDTRVTDLSPLVHCPMLLELNAGKLPIHSLEAFDGLTGLQSLSLYETTIQSLAGMNELTQLKYFEVSGVIDGDLSPMLLLPNLGDVVLGEGMRQSAQAIAEKADFTVSYR